MSLAPSTTSSHADNCELQRTPPNTAQMVLISTSEEWQAQTSLLLKARPSTTRISTKYNIPNLDSPKYQKEKKRKRDAEGDDKDDANTAKVPRATLTLKTFDPESGVVLKFKTDRAAEVGRLISSLGRVGRLMAALPEKEEVHDVPMDDVPMEDAPETEQGGVSLKEAVPVANDAKPQQGGGGKKKKKKNKK